MLHTTEAFFYIKFIPICWFKDNYMQMNPNIVVANEPFIIITQGDYIAETNYMTNGIVFQIHGDLNNDEEKVIKARRIRELYGEFSSIFKAPKKAVYDEDFGLYNTINQ